MVDLRLKTAKSDLEETLNDIEKKIKSFKSLDPPQIDYKLYALLRRLGLTKYEILAYVALVQRGTQTVSQLTASKSKTGIPQPRAYDVLGSLVNYGLVEEKITGKETRRTKEYRAVPPEEGLENFMNFFMFAKNRALEELNSIMPEEEEEKENGGIWSINHQENILRAAKRLIFNAKYEVLLVSEFNILERLIPDLKQCHEKKGITISVIIKEGYNQVENLLDWVKFLKLRFRTIFSMPYLIIDRKYALQWDRDKQNLGQEIENRDIVRTLIDHFFFSNWRIAHPFNDHLNPETVRLYPLHLVNILTAAEEVNLILEKNYSPKLIIYGKITKTGEKVKLKGIALSSKIDWKTGTFNILIRKDDGEELTVGGMLASIEDITADQIIIDYE